MLVKGAPVYFQVSRTNIDLISAFLGCFTSPKIAKNKYGELCYPAWQTQDLDMELCMLYLRFRVTRQHEIELNRNDAMATSRYFIIDTK